MMVVYEKRELGQLQHVKKNAQGTFKIQWILARSFWLWYDYSSIGLVYFFLIW